MMQVLKCVVPPASQHFTRTAQSIPHRAREYVGGESQGEMRHNTVNMRFFASTPSATIDDQEGEKYNLMGRLTFIPLPLTDEQQHVNESLL